MDTKLVDADAFKAAMRTWASGVTILTSVVDGQIHGMTVSAFSSVSAQPPLVLVCANQASFTHEVIEGSGVFGVNILASGQDEISTRFAMGDAAHRFEGVPWTERRDLPFRGTRRIGHPHDLHRRGDEQPRPRRRHATRLLRRRLPRARPEGLSAAYCTRIGISPREPPWRMTSFTSTRCEPKRTVPS